MTEKNQNNNSVDAVNAVEQSFSAQNQEQQNAFNQQTASADEIQRQQTEQQSDLVQIARNELENIKSKAQKADELYDRLLRVSADFDNYKKRMVREKSETIKIANESLILKLLPVLDNLEAALNSANNGNASLDNFKTGISMIYQQLKNALGEFGLEEINAVNSKFDPMFHEALLQMETSEVDEGSVVAQIRKGYLLNSKLIRPAAVVVAKKKEKPADNQSTTE